MTGGEVGLRLVHPTPTVSSTCLFTNGVYQLPSCTDGHSGPLVVSLQRDRKPCFKCRDIIFTDPLPPHIKKGTFGVSSHLNSIPSPLGPPSPSLLEVCSSNPGPSSVSPTTSSQDQFSGKLPGDRCPGTGAPDPRGPI